MHKTRLLRLAVLAVLLVMALAPLPAGAQSSGIPAGATITSAMFSIYADQVILMSGDRTVHVLEEMQGIVRVGMVAFVLGHRLPLT